MGEFTGCTRSPFRSLWCGILALHGCICGHRCGGCGWRMPGWGRKRSIVARDEIQGKLSAIEETHALVKRNRSGVMRGDVQVGAVALCAVVVEQAGHQSGGIASAAIGGEGAESAEFPEGLTVFLDVHALAAHGDELVAGPGDRGFCSTGRVRRCAAEQIVCGFPQGVRV